MIMYLKNLHQIYFNSYGNQVINRQVKHALCFIILFLVASVAYGQINPDSLLKIWNDDIQHDSIRLEALHQVAWDHYLFSEPDSAFYLAQLQFSFAKERGLKQEMSRALNTLGVSNAIRGKYTVALSYLNKCFAIQREVNDKEAMATSLNNIGLIYKDLGNYSGALDYYKQSLKIKEELKNKIGIASSLNNIGNIYKHQGEYEKALEYFTQSLNIKENLDDKQSLANSLNNIGNIHQKQGNYSKALEYYKQCLNIKKELNNKMGIANSLSNIGIVYMDQGDNTKALDYFSQSLKIRQDFDDKMGIAISMNNIGNIHLKQNSINTAISWCKKGLEVSREIGAIVEQRNACKCLYESYKKSGEGNEALKFHEQIVILDDSLKKEEISKKLQQIEFAKQMLADSLEQEEAKLIVQHTHELEMHKKNQQRNIILGSGLLVLVIAVSLFGRLRYVRKSKVKIEKEKDRSDNLLLNILPSEIAEELKEKGEAKARKFDLVSILFTDFKSFTQTSEKLSAENLVAEINHCFKAFDAICEKYQIEKIKTIGDAYMAAGGLPVPSDGSAKSIVMAGLEMQAFITNRKKELAEHGKPSFEMRAGIHSGPVVAGIVGVKKFQYDIWGDTVNTASRLESCGEAGQVNISQCTYRLIKDCKDFRFIKRGKIEAKDKGELEMYFVNYAGA